MISYKEWKLLHESFGTIPLGLSQKQNLGLHKITPIAEMGMDFHKKKNPFQNIHGDEEEDREDGTEDDEMGDMEDDGMGDEEFSDEKSGDEGDEDMGDEDSDEDMPIDPDAEFDDDDDDDEEEEMVKKKFPIGKPHMSGPFMKKMKEGCGDEGDMPSEDDSDEDDDDGDEDMPKDKELTFMQKKQKKMKKKMSAAAKETKIGRPKHDGKAPPKGSGGVGKGAPENQKFKKNCSADMKCKKCAKQKKMKESSDDAAMLRSLESMLGDPFRKYSDGMRDFSEDMLINQEPQVVKEPGPGEVGYAPQTRIGTDSFSENIKELMNKIDKLENQLYKKKRSMQNEADFLGYNHAIRAQQEMKPLFAGSGQPVASSVSPKQKGNFGSEINALSDTLLQQTQQFLGKFPNIPQKNKNQLLLQLNQTIMQWSQSLLNSNQVSPE